MESLKVKYIRKLKSYTFDSISDEVIEVLDHLKIKKVILLEYH